LAWYYHPRIDYRPVRRDAAAAPLSSDAEQERDPSPLAEALRKHVNELAGTIGPRSYRSPDALRRAADYVAREFRAASSDGVVTSAKSDLLKQLKPCMCQSVDTCSGDVIGEDAFVNIELAFETPRPDAGALVVGAHYDSDGYESCGNNPGADDDASGVAVLIELAKRFERDGMSKSVRFVAFTNEEEPFFRSREYMGSYQYATAQLGRARVVAMLSLETLGYMTDRPDSQHLTGWRLLDNALGVPANGDFVAFVGDRESQLLVERVHRVFRDSRSSYVASASVIGRRTLPGIDWSDHRSFWKFGDQEGRAIPAIMVTDTATKRNPCYHQPCDVPATLNYDKLAHVVLGLSDVIKSMDTASPEQ
jgi:hypothetical protein